MGKKDAEVIKALAEIGCRDETPLTPEQEEMMRRAIEPEKFFLDDVEKLFKRGLDKVNELA
jgi:hypothetical protein